MKRELPGIIAVVVLLYVVCFAYGIELEPRQAKRDPVVKLISGQEKVFQSQKDKKQLLKMAVIKQPLAKCLHCELAFTGIHLQKDFPKDAVVAYHFCSPRSTGVVQCVLYDGLDKDAKLLGVEYLVTNAVYARMPEEEKKYWHPHDFEVDDGLLRSLTQTGAAEKATLAVVRPMWGKIVHTWVHGESYPMGPPKVYWSVTGKVPFVLDKDFKRPNELPPWNEAK